MLDAAAYRTLVEQAPILIWRSGLDKGCDYFNDFLDSRHLGRVSHAMCPACYERERAPRR